MQFAGAISHRSSPPASVTQINNRKLFTSHAAIQIGRFRQYAGSAEHLKTMRRWVSQDNSIDRSGFSGFCDPAGVLRR